MSENDFLEIFTKLVKEEKIIFSTHIEPQKSLCGYGEWNSVFTFIYVNNEVVGKVEGNVELVINQSSIR